MAKINVFLADWQVIFREGVHFVLSGEDDIEVVGEATNNEEALDFIKVNLPNIAILNIAPGGVSDIEIARRIKYNFPSVSVILIMDGEDEEQLFLAIKSGARACLTKDADPDVLVDTVKKVALGIYPISEALLRPGIASRVIDEFEVFVTMGERVNNLLACLTPGESAILHGVVNNGGTLPQLTQILDMTEEAVKRELELVWTKLVMNDHSLKLIEAAQSSLSSMIPGDGLTTGKPAAEYITRDEFTEFKESLKVRFRSLFGE